jgi:hypothetical protein
MSRESEEARRVILDHVRYLRDIGAKPEDAALSIGVALPPHAGWDDLIAELAGARQRLHGEEPES